MASNNTEYNYIIINMIYFRCNATQTLAHRKSITAESNIRLKQNLCYLFYTLTILNHQH